eukprot:TRINITY_DN4559_c0_g1_i2.p1 TRINITY_DN4559_c0_g1~~TRINITY_DN4559_c0_g1_i2.p1  ORF type:complete len:119 (+),score=25.53 TRINITY_DN4559_c0_g1_i2:77-433(+)
MSELFKVIDSNNRTFEEHINKGDTSGTAALYTTDSSLYPPGAQGKGFHGREEIKKFWQGVWDANIKNFKLNTGKVTQIADDVVLEESTYQNSSGTGSYIVIWKKVDGHWSLWKDIFNA